MRILIARFGHETNTFSSELCHFKRFAPNGWLLDEAVLAGNLNVPSYLSGMIQAANELGVEIIPTMEIANAGPLITKECLETICDKLLYYIDKYKDEVDGYCLALHGAGCAQTTDDLEGYTLRRVREIVGPDAPITVTLDLHGNITPEMVSLADGLFGIKEYPHVDCLEAGKLAMQSLVAMIESGKKPHTALVRLPMFTTPSVACTFDMPARGIKEHVAAQVKELGLIDATFFHGFPYQDVPCSNSSIVVVADDPDKAQAAAKALADYVWARRERLQAISLTPDEAIDQALIELEKPGDGYVVINEASDNPGGGAPCDGTHLLRALLRREVEGSIVGIIYDPEIALLAHQAGVGGTISGLLGGKTDHIHGEPIAFTDAQVLNLSNGDCRIASPMNFNKLYHYGKTARIRIGTVEVVVTQILATQTLDDRPFLITGADINQYRIVCVKSTNHFRGFYAPRAKAIVTADPPGIHTGNFAQLTYHKIERPLYPLDKDVEF